MIGKHEIDRRMDFGGLSNGRRLIVPFVETTLTGPRLTGIDPPALVVVPNEDVFKSLSALNCALLEGPYLNDCPVLLINGSVRDAEPLLTRFPGRSVWLATYTNELVTLQRLSSETPPSAGTDGRSGT